MFIPVIETESKFILTQGKFTEEETAYYTKQCIASLKYMHN